MMKDGNKVFIMSIVQTRSKKCRRRTQRREILRQTRKCPLQHQRGLTWALGGRPQLFLKPFIEAAACRPGYDYTCTGSVL